MPVNLRLCLVNTTDLIGGAERCSFDLLTGLRERGADVSLVVGRKLSSDPDVHACHYPRWDWMPRAVLHSRAGLTDTTLATPFRMIRNHPAFQDAEVVNIHNMHGAYWNFWTAPTLTKRTSVVFTLHDEWLLTGDCAYTYDCARWQESCGRCPQMDLPVRPALGGADLTRLNLALKRLAMSRTNRQRVHLVTPSEWLKRQIGKSPHLREFPVHVIPNGIDLTTYQPMDKGAARKKFGVPEGKFCFLYFAANLDDPRKGIDTLREMLRVSGLPPDSVLLVVGRRGQAFADEFPGVPILTREYIASREEVSECFSAADCFLMLSLADNLPYTAIEASACGCPILARDVGGVGEIVADRTNGRTIPQSASADVLYRAMQDMASMSAAEWDTMSRQGRDLAQSRFALDQFLSRYEELFSTVRCSPDRRRKGWFGGLPAKRESMSNEELEQRIAQYAKDPANHDRFARLLGEILPDYVAWTWGQDSIYRQHFNRWQKRGFNLAPNHYYSPIPDVDALSKRDLDRPSEMPGLDLREESQLELLDVCRRYRFEYECFPVGKFDKPWEFRFQNGAFERVDAEVLHSMVRHLRPARMIEIGSGFSTLVSAAACERNRLDGFGKCDFSAVEPYPNDLFRQPIPGLSRVIDRQVETLGTDFFQSLGENDILFIDSSHVLKAGSDVQFEYLEVLPRLKSGVVIHIHDIFLPMEYPKNWIFDEHIFWNEQYLLQAFLAFNSEFEVLWAGSYMHRRYPDRLAEVFPGYRQEAVLPGSFWIRRK